MKREEVANHLKAFDPEIYALLEEERQRYTRSSEDWLRRRDGKDAPK